MFLVKAASDGYRIHAPHGPVTLAQTELDKNVTMTTDRKNMFRNAVFVFMAESCLLIHQAAVLSQPLDKVLRPASW